MGVFLGEFLEISYTCDCWDVLDCSPVLGNPSCLQTTSASLKSQKSSHTLPQELLKHTSTRPSCSVRPSTNLTSPVLQTRVKKHKSVHYQYASSHDSLITAVKGLTGSSTVHLISTTNTVPNAITHKRFWDATPE